jgi:REP element-mobilizing transposase RayT
MGRSRYKIYEPTDPHFITCRILHWIPIFTRTETTDIIFDSLKYLQKTDNLKLYAYVILENHLHLIASSDDLAKSMESFKKYIARQIIDLLKERNVTTILDQLAFYKKAHKNDRPYQLWQEGIAPKLIQNDAMMIERINYIHQNPLKRGYVDEASSASDYEDEMGLIEVERFW